MSSVAPSRPPGPLGSHNQELHFLPPPTYTTLSLAFFMLKCTCGPSTLSLPARFKASIQVELTYAPLSSILPSFPSFLPSSLPPFFPPSPYFFFFSFAAVQKAEREREEKEREFSHPLARFSDTYSGQHWAEAKAVELHLVGDRDPVLEPVHTCCFPGASGKAGIWNVDPEFNAGVPGVDTGSLTAGPLSSPSPEAWLSQLTLQLTGGSLPRGKDSLFP